MRNAYAATVALLLGCSVIVSAQWPKHPVAGAPRNANGEIMMDAPAPRTADGRPDLSGVWMRASSAPGRGGGQGSGAADPAGRGGAAPQEQGRAGGAANGQFFGGRGGVIVEIPIDPFPADPNGPPVASFR